MTETETESISAFDQIETYCRDIIIFITTNDTDGLKKYIEGNNINLKHTSFAGYLFSFILLTIKEDNVNMLKYFHQDQSIDIENLITPIEGNDGQNLLHKTSAFTSTKCLKYILQNTNIDKNFSSKKTRNVTPIHVSQAMMNRAIEFNDIISENLLNAAKRNDYDTVKFLLQYNRNLLNSIEGVPTIMCAIAMGDLKLASILVKYGVNLKIKSKNNHNLLHLCVQYDNYEMFKFLIDNGLSDIINDTDNDSRSPLDIAKMINSLKIIDLIESYNKKDEVKDLDSEIVPEEEKMKPKRKTKKPRLN